MKNTKYNLNEILKGISDSTGENQDYELVLIRSLLVNKVYVPSSNVIEQGHFMPLFFNKEGERMMSIFSSTELMRPFEKDIKAYMTMLGRDVILQIPNGYGVVCNPGHNKGFDISAQGVANVAYDLYQSDCG